jgi:DNA polymerase-3 subunit epsilon/ATP-dependent DNA helicase DinG
VLDTFSQLVDPGRSVPARITQITGIRTADVAGKPRIADLAAELRAFVGSDVAAVMAHSANFDIGFLRAAGIEFHRPVFDTLELAQMLLPGLASYSLSELCQALNTTARPDHRAFHDAHATAELFWRLCQHAAALPSAVHDLLLETARDESNWAYTQFFADTRSPSPALWNGHSTGEKIGNDAPAHPAGIRSDTHSSRQPVSEGAGPAIPVAESTLLGYLAADGPLASLLGNHFEQRSGQTAMAAQVLHALNTGDYLLVEAGTGTGKSLAYLLPAALFALANHCRVLVATNTIALQDQLVEKDIPQVQALLAVRPPPLAQASAEEEEPVLQAAVLKGRLHYLCTRRLHEWRTSHLLTALEMTVLAKVLVWLALIGEGDAADIVLNTPGERAIWSRICSDAATCTQERCAAFGWRPGAPAQADGGALWEQRDFYWEARRQAEAAHLLIVNHALLLADLQAEGRVLPPYRNLIVDETHRLEEAATDQLTYRVEWPAVQLLLRRLAADGDLASQIGRTAAGLGHDGVAETLASITQQANRSSRLLSQFAEQLTFFARSQQEPGRSEGGYAQRLALDGAARSQPDWSRIEIEWGEARPHLQQLVRSVELLLQQLDAAHWRLREPTAALLAELRELHAGSAELARQLDDILLAPGGRRAARVAWMEGADNSATVTLATAPLTVNEVLERELLQRRRCAIFTGATLRTGSSFRFIRDRLGLWDVKLASIDSPFDYKRSTLLYLPSDMPLPNHPHYQQMVEQAIVEAAVAAAGRTLVLFTSYQQLRATSDAIRPQLERQGVALFQHGQSSRFRLLREYRAAEQAVLLGTRTFWEGIDLPGDELTCLLIARLPFAVPNDPLVAARSAEFEDPFQEYTVPDAVLRFRQGFGRLIRRAGDRGAVVLLDSRAWRKDYGAIFLESLPECTVRRQPLQNLGREVRSWLGRTGTQSGASQRR